MRLPPGERDQARLDEPVVALTAGWGAWPWVLSGMLMMRTAAILEGERPDYPPERFIREIALDQESDA
jgi:hypothetical protein